jgi:hypothetical protein
MSKSTVALLPCSCLRFGVDCGRVTYKTWAPGHDAKAKSLLQAAHRNGEEVVVDGVIMSARQGAEAVVPALVPFLYYRKGSLQARFADDDAALKDSAFSAQIKVGRWTYNALVAGSVVTYVTAKGEAKTMDVSEAQFVS